MRITWVRIVGGKSGSQPLTGIKNSLSVQACAPNVRIGSVMSLTLEIAQ